jgi:TolB protein
MWAGSAATLPLVFLACSGTESPDSPTADIKANGADGPVTVAVNEAVHLSWSSEVATSCRVSPGGWDGTTGSATVEDLTATTTYRLSCTGPGGEAEDSVHIVVAPPGTQIVFQSSDSTDSDIYVVNADGLGLTRLTDYPDADVSPSWSADGRQIYFLSYNRDGGKTWDLYVMDADGSDVHLVADSLSRTFAVSPDGKRIALAATTPMEFPQNADLFVMNADGSERTRLVDLPCDEYYTHCEQLQAVDWSPDGQRIVYAAYFAGHGSEDCNIGVVNADGTGQRILTSSGGNLADPAWGPDGQRIVFSSHGTLTTLHNPQDLEIINADGTGRVVVLDGENAAGPVNALVNTSASWSPDGQSIVFAHFQASWASTLPEESELFVINVDGTGLRRVTTVPGGAFAPDWNPAGP